jgi:hypothetical protein
MWLFSIPMIKELLMPVVTDQKFNPLSPPCIPPNPGFRDLPAKSKFLADLLICFRERIEPVKSLLSLAEPTVLLLYFCSS